LIYIYPPFGDININYIIYIGRRDAGFSLIKPIEGKPTGLFNPGISFSPCYFNLGVIESQWTIILGGATMQAAKKNKLAFLILSLGCVVAMGVCLICDLAINGRMAWAGYPVASVMFGWVALAPLALGGKRGLWLSLLTLTLSLLPFLWLLERLTPVGGWFRQLAAPCAVIFLAATWVMALLIRFAKIGKWYLMAIAVSLYGVFGGTAVRFYVSGFLGRGLFSLDNLVNFFGCTALAVLCVIMGVRGRQKE
jgi:hypothetical protein